MSIIRNTADQIGDKIDVKREIDTMLAAKKYEFQVMSVIPFGIVLYMTVSFPEFMGNLYGNIAGRGVMTGCLIIYWAHTGLGERSSRSKSEYRDYVSGVFGGRCSSYLGLQWCLQKNVEEITRKTYGKGKKTEELRVEGKDRVLGEIPIEVTEQVYGEQEISQVLKQAVKK